MASPSGRDRSRSPRRPSNREPTISKGLKWKSKGASTDTAPKSKSYRERDSNSKKDTERETRKDRPLDSDDTTTSKPKLQEEAALPSSSIAAENLNTTSKFGASTVSKFGKAANASATTETSAPTESSSKEVKKTKTSTPAAATGTMIIVTVNDRLGTKAQIPCMASDPVKAFKAMVAARIGRQPHEIMIKRQGERPFKDQLTLEDYGVSNGVQLDLELDTGD